MEDFHNIAVPALVAIIGWLIRYVYMVEKRISDNETKIAVLKNDIENQKNSITDLKEDIKIFKDDMDKQIGVLHKKIDKIIDKLM